MPEEDVKPSGSISEASDWAQFQQLTDLHKFYFENLIKAASFSFGLIGAILTYVISAKLLDYRAALVLSFPALLSIGSCILFSLGCWLTWDLNKTVDALKSKMKLSWKPHTQVLIMMCVIFALMFLLAFIGILILMVKPGFGLPPNRCRVS